MRLRTMWSTLVCVIALSCGVRAMTLAYWQLDDSADGGDAVLANHPAFYDLTAFGVMNQGSPAVATIPNPSAASWRYKVRNAQDNTGSQLFADGSGWYMNPANEKFFFHNDTSFTAECWFKAGGTSAYIFGNRHADSYLLSSGWFTGWQLWVTGGPALTLFANGNPNYTEGGASTSITISTPISLNRWYHAAVVWDHDEGATGEMRLYLDGVEVASAAGDPTWDGVTGGSWAIGHRNLWVDEEDLEAGVVWGNNGFSGQIDEVRIVSEALAPEYFLNGTTAYVNPLDTILEGDMNIDGHVDLSDLAEFVRYWMQTTDPSDPDAVQMLH